MPRMKNLHLLGWKITYCSYKGNKCIFLAYDFNSNTIIDYSMPKRKASTIVSVFQDICNMLDKRNKNHIFSWTMKHCTLSKISINYQFFGQTNIDLLLPVARKQFNFQKVFHQWFMLNCRLTKISQCNFRTNNYLKSKTPKKCFLLLEMTDLNQR